MASYVDAINKVLEHEGGFVNHPADKGGATNWGVTIGTYSTYLGRPATVAEVQAMTRDTAVKIYKKMYWDKMQGDKIKLFSIAAAIFDQAINRGVTSAVKQAQKVLGIAQDGVVVPVTLAAINAASDLAFIPKYIQESKNFYQSIVSRDATQSVFLKGWLARADSLYAYAMSYIGEINGKKVGIGIGVVVALGLTGYAIYKLSAGVPAQVRIA